ncbi:lipocalin [Acidovorax sp. Root267]|uniref:lipocalin family protein n=1 Tax=Acidovorax sp. Root267 TaxID=1736505 RepID=UPI00070E0E4C|nr:lipocalin family protein [Acidovorax sp. Root267]KRD15107.1 lipocalin [Acidovorax sp. Root267]
MSRLFPWAHRSVLLVMVMVAMVLALTGCSSASPPPGIAPFTPFDLARYEGRWYEVARLDHPFERGMTDVSATYQRRGDGSVRVLNRGFDTGKNDWRQSEGKAKFTGDASTASLKVSFFGPFYGGYHVAALDADYQWALVVGPDRSYCWILSRTKQLAPAVREQLIARANVLGIDTQALIWVTHERTDPKS